MCVVAGGGSPLDGSHHSQLQGEGGDNILWCYSECFIREYYNPGFVKMVCMFFFLMPHIFNFLFYVNYIGYVYGTFLLVLSLNLH